MQKYKHAKKQKTKIIKLKIEFYKNSFIAFIKNNKNNYNKIH